MKIWLATTAGKIIAALVLVVLVAGLFAVRSCQSARTAKTATKLATSQAGASLASGADAVDTVGSVQGNEIAGDALTKENDDAIRQAEGAGAPVSAPVRDAGLASLCRRAAYRGDPKCVQHAPAR